MIPDHLYQTAIERFRQAASVLLTTHVKPDADGLGALAALRRWLLDEGAQVEVVLPSAPAEKYAFLDPEGVFQRPAVMPRVPVNIWRTLLWIAALLLPLDVAVRRLVIRREDLALFTQPLRSAARRLRVTRVVTRPATIERLLTRKQAARRPAAPQPPIEPIEIAPPEPEARPAPSPEAPEPSAEQPAPPREPEESTTSRLLRRKRQLRQPRH